MLGNPFIGTTYFALYGIEDSTTVSYTTWFFQWTFSLTSATIGTLDIVLNSHSIYTDPLLVSGSLLERTRLRAYLVCTFISSAWIYPVVAHWIWATDGTLHKLDMISYGPLIDTCHRMVDSQQTRQRLVLREWSARLCRLRRRTYGT